MPGYFSTVGTSGAPVVTSPVKAAAATNGAVNVTNVSTAVLAANANRKKLILTNDSAEDMWVFFGTPAVADQGIRLNAYGGSVTDDTYTGVVTAITAGAGPNVLVVVEM